MWNLGLSKKDWIFRKCELSETFKTESFSRFKTQMDKKEKLIENLSLWGGSFLFFIESWSASDSCGLCSFREFRKTAIKENITR